MNTSTVIVSVGTAGAVFAVETLASETGRAVVIGLAVLAAGATGRWIWRAIVRQLGAEVTSRVQAELVTFEHGQNERIKALTEQSERRHAEHGSRLAALEQTRVDPTVLQHIFAELEQVSRQLHELRTPDHRPEGN